MSRWQFAAAILCAALLAGCTASFTYNHLDRLIPWYVDGYVDLTRQQRKALESQLEPVLQWHREEELARYISILDQIEQDLASPLTAGVVQVWIDELGAAVERAEESLLSLALDFGTTLSDAQMAEFVASLWERQREYESELLERSEEEYRRDSYDGLADFLRRFTGPLEPGQEQRLRKTASELYRFDQAWLEERAAWLETLEPLLQRKPGWQQQVQAAHAVRKAQRTPRYREFLAHNVAMISAGVADVMSQLTERQRQRVSREIDDLRARLRELSSRSRLAGFNRLRLPAESRDGKSEWPRGIR